MRDYIKRYGTWVLLVAMLAGIAIQPDLLATITIAAVATLQTVILADVVQWLYTGVRWTQPEPQSHEVNEIVIAGKMRVLGHIYLGTAILIGLVYYAVYYVQRIPGVTE